MSGPDVPASALCDAVADHLGYLAAHGYAPTTLRARRYHLRALVTFLEDLEVTEPTAVTPALLEAYQRHLFHHRTRTGAPLSFATQAQRLVPVKAFFSWCARSGRTPYDPAASLVLPKTEHRLPEATLSAQEAEAVLAVPDTTTALGLRDRAVMEVLYSCAIRRAELIGLRVSDLDMARGTLFVRQGKGGRDRHVPIGERAATWVRRYMDDVRPHFATGAGTETLFLTTAGRALSKNLLSKLVTGYVAAGCPEKRGSCHLFRHSAATLMLDAGADVRHVAELLGHRKLETTMVYTRVSIAKLQAVHRATHPAERQAGTTAAVGSRPATLST